MQKKQPDKTMQMHYFGGVFLRQSSNLTIIEYKSMPWHTGEKLDLCITN